MYFSELKFTKLIQFSLKNSLLSLISRKRISNINNFINNPIKSQSTVFKSLIQKGLKTKYGQEHYFNKIYDYNSFKKNIPLRNYEELEPYIKRARNNEKNVLWPGYVKFFAKSSGTANNKSKFIPITKESLNNCHFKAGKDMLSLYENNFPNTNVYKGKGLMLGGSMLSSKNAINITGDLSAILLDQFPYLLNIFFWVF